MDNEQPGFIPTSDYYEANVFKGSRWRVLPINSLSIGQGELGITPLQMANYAVILANRGFYYIPHVVKKIGDDGSIDKRFKTKNNTLIDDKYFKDVIDGMQQVFEPGGTGYMSRVNGITMCGKTGTAQNPHGSDHSVFILFAPRENPKIAISVYVENGIEGARYAAPIASLIAEKYLTGSISASRKWLEKRMLDANLLNPVQPE